MITLKDTSETLKLTTSSTADIDYSVSYVDISPTAFSPSSSEGKINTAANTTIASAPDASTQRQIKLICVRNTHASSSNTVTFYKDISTVIYKLTADILLLAGESVGMTADGRWIIYGSNGAIKGEQTASGAATQIQFNDSGVLGGDADLVWDKTSNALTLGGTDTKIVMKGATSEPAVPNSGSIAVYPKAVCGKMQLKIKGPSGLDTPLQAAIWQNNTVLFTPGASAGLYQGTVGSNLGTAAIVLPTTTNLYTMMRRSTFASVVTTTNQQVGVRTENMFCRGNATGLGGFLFACRFGFTSIKAGCRAFVGLCADTSAIVTADPSSKLNMCGFAFDLADTAWTFMHNDGVGVATKDAIAGQGVLATNNTSYDAYIWCAPNASTVYYRLDRTHSGSPVTLVDSSTSTDLPVNTTLLCAQCVMSNGTANTVVGDATIGVSRMYIETDR